MGGNYYLHPLKVWQRSSETMFLPHLICGEDAKPITSSAETALLFTNFKLNCEKTDYWDVVFQEAAMKLSSSQKERRQAKELLLKLLIGEEPSIYELAKEYFSLRDLLNIQAR